MICLSSGTTAAHSSLFDVHWPDIWVGHVFFGAVIGLIVALVAELWVTRRRFRRLKREADIEGTYSAYLFRNSGDEVDYDKTTGTVVVTHEREDVFAISHVDPLNENRWSGTIYMTSPRDGRIVWKYEKLHGQEPIRRHRMGFKRCLVSTAVGKNGTSCRVIYLIGEPPDYGKEYLERL